MAQSVAAGRVQKPAGRARGSGPDRKQKWKRIRKDWQLYTFLVIPVVYFLIFKYLPMVGNVIAFRKYVPAKSIFGVKWVGLKYFNMFIQDPSFWHIFLNTITLSVETLIFTFPAPIILALLLNELRNLKFKSFVQTASYLPHFVSTVMLVGIIFEFTASSGPINSLVKAMGGSAVSFMQDPKYFHSVYIISRVWQSTGWGTIMYLAALTAVNPDLYEAARIDGANRWKQTLHVTLPGIRPTIVTLLVLSIGSIMGVSFEQIILMYNPSTYETADVISSYVYRIGLTQNSYSYAAAIGLFESIIGLILVSLANYLSRKLTDSSLW
ncbi:MULTISPECIES: ABC transporter permease [Caproicibacterium]|uniref:ABC transporter permease subunit n=1 Tax=Caproicibacterium argilliputei TaxID=3030016 RepID=A0AA97DAI9_9FIRM|nr:ABC transporter permease subunit [Caproicibacterium argilliputei]WOC32637.1 ABC transporter permease subunit [Caproicibacterium argilliputei]